MQVFKKPANKFKLHKQPYILHNYNISTIFTLARLYVKNDIQFFVSYFKWEIVQHD